jgi:hypothetical protein
MSKDDSIDHPSPISADSLSPWPPAPAEALLSDLYLCASASVSVLPVEPGDNVGEGEELPLVVATEKTELVLPLSALLLETASSIAAKLSSLLTAESVMFSHFVFSRAKDAETLASCSSRLLFNFSLRNVVGGVATFLLLLATILGALWASPALFVLDTALLSLLAAALLSLLLSVAFLLSLLADALLSLLLCVA